MAKKQTEESSANAAPGFLRLCYYRMCARLRKVDLTHRRRLVDAERLQWCTVEQMDRHLSALIRCIGLRIPAFRKRRTAGVANQSTLRILLQNLQVRMPIEKGLKTTSR